MGSRTRWLLLAVAAAAAVAGLLWIVRGGSERTLLIGEAPRQTDSSSGALPPLSATDHADRSAVPRGEREIESGNERGARAPQGHATLEVHVVRDEDSAPIPSAIVEVVAGDAFRRSHSADVEGVGRFWVPVGEQVTVRAEADALYLGRGRAVVEPLAEAEVRKIRIRLPRETPVDFHGIVLDRSTGAPLAKARIRREGFIVPRPGVETDPGGRFAITAPTRPMRAPELLRVEHDGHHPMTVEVTSGHAHPDAPFSILLGSCGVLDAHVIGGDGFVLVRLETSAFHLAAFGSTRPLDEGELRWEAPLDGVRVAAFECIEPGVPLRASLVRADGTILGVGVPLLLGPGERREVTWELSASIRGRAADERGAPVAGVELWLLAEAEPGAARKSRTFFSNELSDAAATTTTDEEGRFSFSSLTPGSWWIGPGATSDPQADGSSDHSKNAVLVAVNGPGEHVCELRLWRDLFIEGRVTAPSGSSPAGAHVSAFATDGRGALDVTAGADGRFALGPLAPGSYQLRAWGRTRELAYSVDVAAEAGATGVELALRRNGKIVVHAPDVGPGDGQLTFQWAPSDGEAFESVMTTVSFESDGRFRWDGIAPGRYDFTLELPDGRVGTAARVLVDSEHEYDRVDLLVERGGVLRIRCEGGSPDTFYRVFRDEAFVAGGGLSGPGAADVVHVPPGRNVIVVRDPLGRMDEKVVVVEPGGTSEVVVHPRLPGEESR